MKIEAEVPEPFHIMTAQSSGRNSGWSVWVRQPNLGQFRGGHGATLQEAVDRAVANLRKTLAAEASYRPTGPTLQLNLAALRLTGEMK